MMKLFFFCLLIPTPSSVFFFFVMFFIIFMSLALPQMSFNCLPEMEFLSFSLVLLTAWLFILMLNASFKTKYKNLMQILMKILFLSLVVSFFSSSFLAFYFFFEVSLIPIFWIIMGWGYQPERLLASLMMFFYTMTSSLPLLITLLSVWSTTFSSSFFFSLCSGVSPMWVSLTLSIAFLVKFPMYFVHFWLPKAHVEAPVAGSMILAGVLLKLGGYGLYRLNFLLAPGIFNYSISILSLVGASILGLMCCRLSDMKVIIAYSSVVHMAMIIASLMSSENFSVPGIWWVMLAHGLVSSGLFACANIFYDLSHSRNLLNNKGLLSFSPFFSLLWFILLMMNFSGPFTLNLFGEINLIISVYSFSIFFALTVFFLVFFSAAYSLVLYASTQQGLSLGNLVWLKSPSSREAALLWTHLWPIFFLLADLNL